MTRPSNKTLINAVIYLQSLGLGGCMDFDAEAVVKYRALFDDRMTGIPAAGLCNGVER